MDPLPAGVTIEHLLELHRKAELQKAKHREYAKTEQGKQKSRESAARYYARNKEVVREKMREYVANNRESVNQRNLQYYHAHRDDILERNRTKRAALAAAAPAPAWLGSD